MYEDKTLVERPQEFQIIRKGTVSGDGNRTSFLQNQQKRASPKGDAREMAEAVSRSPKSVDNAVQRIRRKVARRLTSGDLSVG